MNDDMNAQDDQALADEWAAALEETGDAGQDDIDALLAADTAGSSSNRLPMEEFGSVAKNNDPVSLEGPNLDVILDIPVSISMEVGSTDINIRNLLQLNQGSVIELDGGGGDLHVTMPYSMIEPVREMLDAGFQSDLDDQDERWVNALRQDVLDVDVPIGATVARRQLRLRDILHMQPGDIIPVEMPEEMIMRANGVPAFKVKMGSHKGNLALQVIEPIERR